MIRCIVIVVILHFFTAEANGQAVPEFSKEIAARINECKKNFSVTDEMLMKKTKLQGTQKCYFQCTATNVEIINEKGELTLEKFRKIAQGPNVELFIAKVKKCGETIPAPKDEDSICSFCQDLRMCLING